MTLIQRRWGTVGGITAALMVGVLATIAAQNPAAEMPPVAKPQAAAPASDIAKPAKMPTYIIAGDRRDLAAIAAINQKLNQEIDISTDRLPLTEFVDFLKKKTGLEIQLDQKALEAAGVGFDTPVSRNLAKVSARSTLHLVLKQLDLTFVIQNEVLLITTSEEASNKMQIRIYPVRDLVRRLVGPQAETPRTISGHPGFQSVVPSAHDQQPSPREALTHSSTATKAFDEPDDLIQLITATIQPSTWDDATPGSLRYSDSAGCLIFLQTQEVHEEIAALLEALREAKQLQQ